MDQFRANPSRLPPERWFNDHIIAVKHLCALFMQLYSNRLSTSADTIDKSETVVSLGIKGRQEANTRNLGALHARTTQYRVSVINRMFFSRQPYLSVPQGGEGDHGISLPHQVYFYPELQVPVLLPVKYLAAPPQQSNHPFFCIQACSYVHRCFCLQCACNIVQGHAVHTYLFVSCRKVRSSSTSCTGCLWTSQERRIHALGRNSNLVCQNQTSWNHVKGSDNSNRCEEHYNVRLYPTC